MPDGLTPSASSRIMLTTDAVGGVWRYSLDLARGLSPRPILAVLGPPPSAAQRAEAAALGICPIETGLPLDWTADSPAELDTAARELRGLAEREGASAVHLHAPALVGDDRWPMPVVAVAHSCVATWWSAARGGPLPPDLAWRAAATGAGLRMADAVIAPSHAHARATRLAYGDCPIAVVHNGARSGDHDDAAPPPVVPDAPGRRSVLTAGRLWDEGKNAAALDRAAAALDAPILAAGPLAGPNGARIDLPALRCLGNLSPEAMAGAYAGSAVFASLARYEPFGLAVLEAAQAGLRLVLSDIPTFRELWDGVARFVPLDADPVPALRAALDDGDDAGALVRGRTYTIERTVAGTLAVHRRLGARV